VALEIRRSSRRYGGWPPRFILTSKPWKFLEECRSMRSRVCGKWLILVAILVAGSDASFAVAYMYGIKDGVHGRMEVVLRSALPFPLPCLVPGPREPLG
jgi:hypothetical protein